MYPTALLRQFPLLFLVALLIGAAGGVAAQNSYDLGTLSPGEIMLNLDANEQTEVEQDTLHANLYFSAQGRDRVALQDEVNRMMAAALEILEDGDIEYSTQQYHVYPVQVGRPTRADIDNPVWRAQQGVMLTSQDSEALLELAAQLQGMGLTMGSLNYSLSPARYEEVSDTLMEAVLTTLRNRADATAAALGKRSAELVEVTLNASNNFFPRGMAMTTMAADASMEMARPVAEPGMATVMVSVSARAILMP